MARTESFDWSREVPAGWQADLDRLWPGENVSRPMLSWLAGFPYAPVQRWVIYEVLPAKVIGDILEEEAKEGIDVSLTRSLWEQLQGADPRERGHWVEDRSVDYHKRWRSDPDCMISRNQWDLHRATGGFPRLVWIIEGPHGGHAWQFGDFERDFLIAAGTNPEFVDAMTQAWPNPGTLPYADYSPLVTAALHERDILQHWQRNHSQSWLSRTKRTMAGIILGTESVDRRKEMQARMVRWIDNQIGDAVSDIPRRLLPPPSAYTKVDGPAPDMDAADRQLVEG